MGRFDRTPTGDFHNIENIRLVWREPDWFEYIPDANGPFYYSTSRGVELMPGRFFFDGGSTPFISRVFKRASPWYYVPVALVHDWLAEMQACGTPLTDLEGAVRIQQEALKTMMIKNKEWKSLMVFDLSRRGLVSRKARRIWGTLEEECPIPIHRKKQRLKL